jgi:hypothetical protein
MKRQVYSLYDEVSEYYLSPLFLHNDAEATRMFLDILLDDKTMPGRHPKDYKLYQIGTYEDAQGMLNPIEDRINRLITTGSLLLNEYKANQDLQKKE